MLPVKKQHNDTKQLTSYQVIVVVVVFIHTYGKIRIVMLSYLFCRIYIEIHVKNSHQCYICAAEPFCDYMCVDVLLVCVFTFKQRSRVLVTAQCSK